MSAVIEHHSCRLEAPAQAVPLDGSAHLQA